MARIAGSGLDQNDRRYIAAAMRAPMLEREYEADLGRRWRDERDRKALDEEIRAGHAMAGVVIPPTYLTDLRRGRVAEAQVIVDAADPLLRAELAKPGYRVSPMAFGTNTDCYQPAERKFRIMRQLLEVLDECRHPLTIVTKSALVERDLDLLAPLAKKNLVKVFVSIGTLDRALARNLEPRAASPQRRLDTVRALNAAGVPCGVMVAALVPALTDKTLEQVLEEAAKAGAREAAYIILRLPNELKAIFREWLAAHYPERAEHVISIVRQMRGGRDNDPRFHQRMRGTGNYAELIAKRFDVACRRLGLNGHGGGRRPPELDCSRFVPPSPAGQMKLF